MPKVSEQYLLGLRVGFLAGWSRCQRAARDGASEHVRDEVLKSVIRQAADMWAEQAEEWLMQRELEDVRRRGR